MTTTEHLSRIRARCVELLEIASKRTPGEWSTHRHPDGEPIGVGGDEFCGSPSVCYLNACANSDFIASCAGHAEAGWAATIAAIDGLQAISKYDANSRHGEGICQYGCDTPCIAKTTIQMIIAVWPEEIL
jgi:hypothetical protein